MKKAKFLAFLFILFVFSFTFLATSVEKELIPCNDDCARVLDFDTTFRKGRRDYVISAERCNIWSVSDTLCIYVKDTLNINWNLLADTACTLATQKGLIRQKIFFLKYSPPSNNLDTLLKKECP